jgi:hypothetical protein
MTMTVGGIAEMPLDEETHRLTACTVLGGMYGMFCMFSAITIPEMSIPHSSLNRKNDDF